MTSDSASAENSTPASKVRYVHSPSLALLLQEACGSIAVTTYQAGRVVIVRARKERISTLFRTFDQPMGLAVGSQQMAMTTRRAIVTMRNAPDVAEQMEPVGVHDSCFVPLSTHITGDIRAHEIGWDVDDSLWVVNTRFSCLCGLDDKYSFTPLWRPPFITRYAAEDRCHLNGLAFEKGQPKYVTALGVSDQREGWRENKNAGGVVMDVPTGEVIARGFAMPHSPRIYRDQLWLLDSGRGQLVTVDPATGRSETVAQLPGYARGLDFVGRYALIGLSKIRETAIFGGVPIAEQHEQLKCGVWVVDIESGQTVAVLEFEIGVTELFDVKFLHGARYPALLGLDTDLLSHTFIVPSSVIAETQTDTPPASEHANGDE